MRKIEIIIQKLGLHEGNNLISRGADIVFRTECHFDQILTEFTHHSVKKKQIKDFSSKN